MAGRTPSALTRTVSQFRSFLRNTWISRINLAEWLTSWTLPTRKSSSSAQRKRGAQLAVESLECRGSPDDFLGILQSGWLGAGGALLTPGMVLLKGWEFGQVADAGVQIVAATGTGSAVTADAAAPPNPGLPTWTPVGNSLTTALDSNAPTGVPTDGMPSSAGDLSDNPFQDALSDNWLNAVGAMLDSQRPDSMGSAAGGDASGGAGSNGAGNAGGSSVDNGLNLNSSMAAAPSADTNSNLAALAGIGTSAGVTTANPAPIATPPAATPAALPLAVSTTPSGNATTTSANLATATPTTNGNGSTQAQSATAALDLAYAKAPLAFEPNMGQTDPSVRYYSHGPGLSLFLTDGGATLAMPRTDQPGIEDVLGLQFTGANPHPQITASNDLLSRSNYFTQGQAITNVPQYSELEYKDIYPGIDLLFQQASTGGRQLEYEFLLAPGANPSEIHLTWQGAQSITQDPQGNLDLQTAGGQLVETAPTFYQPGTAGVNLPVSGQQVVNGDQVSFAPGSYDPTKPLVIDPTLGSSSYLGGSGADEAYAIAVDANGSSYVTGQTTSFDFPTTVGVFQSSKTGPTSAFVTKLAPNGSIVYSSYLGGLAVATGNASDFGIAVDYAGAVYLTGNGSSDFPTTSGAYDTSAAFGAAFISKLNAAGSALDYSTFLPGGSTTAIAIDPLGNAYVTGATGTTSFPTTSGVYQSSLSGTSDAFVTKLNPQGSALVYSSYLGNGTTNGLGIALGQSATGAYQAFITGNTTSTTFPTSTGVFQTSVSKVGFGTPTSAFVSALNATGTGLVYSTYVSGSNSDSGNAIAVDRQGNAYITGSTKSTDFPTSTGAYQTALGGGGLGSHQNAFVTKLNATGTVATYSTYLGGSGLDAGNAIAVDNGGLAYISGQTTSTNFPTASGAFQSTINSASTAAFVTRLAVDGKSLSYSSYLGGGSSSTNIATGIGLDVYQNAFVAGYTNATNFPTANPSQSSNAGGYDAFISKVVPQTLPPVFSGTNPDIIGVSTVSLSGTAVSGATVKIYRADLGYLTSVTATGGNWSYTATLPAEGTYSFTATATANSSTSNASTPFVVTEDVTAPSVTVVAPANTYTEAPQVIVQASDLNGLSDGTTVTLKVDVNRDGGYANSQTAPLVGGYATFTAPTLAVGHSYNMKAQVTDLAGNTGTSAVVAVQVNSDTPGIQTAGPAVSDPQAGDSMLQMGNLQLTHDLMSLDTSPDQGAAAGSPVMIYNSAEVSVQPVIQASVLSDNSQALPATVSAALTWNSTTGSTFTYNTTGASPGDLLTLAIQEPTTVTSTGAYSWSLTVVMNYGTPVSYTSSGTAYVVTQDSSVFGAGWWLSSLDQLVPVTGGVMYVYGTGLARFWSGSSTFTAPAGDNGTLTLSGGVYTYTTPTNEQTKFNSSGYETSWTSGDGLSTITYTYDGSNRVSTITAIDGTPSTFTYSSGLLQTIKTSNSRTTSFAYDGSNNLTQITNPDGGVHTFTYDGSHDATGETFANIQNSWAYNDGALATITTGSSGSPTVQKLAPAMLQGLETGSTGNLFNIGDVYAKETDPALGTSTYTYATKAEMDLQGRTTKDIAANGAITQYTLDANGRVTVMTDPMNRVTTYALDSDGYVTQTTYPDTTTSSSQYQAGAYHLVTKTTDQNGNVTSFTYDNLGHQTTVKDALLETTTSAYDATTGLVTTVTDPLIHTSNSTYDSKRRLSTTTDAATDVTTYTYRSFAATKDKEYNGVVHLGQVNWSHLGLVDHTNRKEQRREVFYCQAC